MSSKISSYLRDSDLIIGGLFCILIAGFFIIPTSPHRLVLYATFVFGLLHIHKNRSWEYFSLNFDNKLFIWIMAFLLYALISNFWSNIDEVERLIQKTKPAVFISLFILIGISYLKRKGNAPLLWMEVYVLTAAVTSFVLLIINAGNIYDAYLENEIWRIHGFGRVENSNQAGLFYGIALIVLFFLKPKFIRVLGNKYFRAVCIIAIVLVFLLALSRGAFMAFSVTLVFTILLKVYRSDLKKIFIFAPILTLIFVAFVMTLFFPHLITYMVERGTTGRFELWQHGYEQFLQRPLFGHGAGTKFYYELEFPTHIFVAGHLHNLYLAVLVHFGLVGLSLLLLIIHYVFFGLVRFSKETNDYGILVVFVFGCVFGLVDLGGHYNSLSTSWMIFWIPALVSIAHQKFAIDGR